MDFNWRLRHESAGFISGIYLAAIKPLAQSAVNLYELSITATRQAQGFRIIFPILVPCSCPRMVFSASLSVSCVSRTGGQAMWEMKRGLPSGDGELDLNQLWVRRTCVLCTPNHLSFKGMFMFAHFSPSIVPEEAELMRMLMGWVREMQGPSSYLSHACFESRFW